MSARSPEGNFFFNRYVGLQAEGGVHEWSSAVSNNALGSRGNDDGFTTASGGVLSATPRRV